MIDDYFHEIESAIRYTPDVIHCDISTTRINEFAGIIKGRVQFPTVVLDFIEVIYLRHNPKRSKKKYKFHVMNCENELIFRYDNVPHFPNLLSFPHHKHTTDDVIESDEPTIHHVLREIRNLLK